MKMSMKGLQYFTHQSHEVKGKEEKYDLRNYK